MQTYFQAILDLIYPPRCACCLKLTEKLICGRCAPLLPTVGGRICEYCGKPMVVTTDGCRGRHLHFTNARAVWVYEGIARDVIHSFKYKNQKNLAHKLSLLLVPLIGKTDIITWVPLTRRKSWNRGYNQARLLAKWVAGETGLPGRDLLRRTRQTQDQSRLDPASRRRNVKGAFGTKGNNSLTGSNITLVDDVYTTGSTVAECARVLNQAGAVSVHVVTLARTLLHG